jgi:hypothetical protein
MLFSNDDRIAAMVSDKLLFIPSILLVSCLIRFKNIGYVPLVKHGVKFFRIARISSLLPGKIPPSLLRIITATIDNISAEIMATLLAYLTLSSQKPYCLSPSGTSMLSKVRFTAMRLGMRKFQKRKLCNAICSVEDSRKTNDLLGTGYN